MYVVWTMVWQPCFLSLGAANMHNVVPQAAKDFRADPDLYEQCKPDAQQLCANVEPGEGRVQSCLVRHGTHDCRI